MDDEFTGALRDEVWKSVVRRPFGSTELPRTPSEAAKEYLEPLVREIGKLRAEVERLKSSSGCIW